MTEGLFWVEAIELLDKISMCTMKLGHTKKEKGVHNVLSELNELIVDYNRAVRLSHDKDLKQTSLKEVVKESYETALDLDLRPSREDFARQQRLKRIYDSL